LLCPVVVRTCSATATLVSIGLLGGGCAHERLASPPPAADIARSNAAAEKDKDGRSRIESVEPIGTGEWVKPPQPTEIAAVEDPQVGFRAGEGDMHLVPSEMFKRSTVRDPWEGAMIGGALGAAAGGLAVLELLALESLFRNDDPSLPPSPCRNICNVGDVAPFVVTGFAIGAVVGYLVGGPRRIRGRTGGY
jgi:hypothetical protein